jgi:hypothetical protein
MLQDKYLPKFHFQSAHTIQVNVPVEGIYPLLSNLKFKHSGITYWLMKLRGMNPPEYFSTQWFEDSHFVKLEETQNQEVILGIIGQPWKLVGNLQKFQPHEFIPFNNSEFIKATWSFEVVRLETQTVIKTETRILCGSEHVRRRFGRYWFFIKPFSGLIRRDILKSIKKEVEQAIHSGH